MSFGMVSISIFSYNGLNTHFSYSINDSWTQPNSLSSVKVAEIFSVY